MKTKLWILFVCFISLVGCNISPKYDVSPDWDKLKLSKVFIYRTDVSYHSFNPEKPFFYINGKQIGKLGTGQSISTMVPAGRHVISIKEPFLFMPSYESATLEFVAEPNKEYYIRYSEDSSGGAVR